TLPVSARQGSRDSSNGIATITNRLDNLERDMRKLKDIIHAIHVGSKICAWMHLTKQCPLKEEGKAVEEVEYVKPISLIGSVYKVIIKILANSPTSGFHFCCGLKQGDPLAHFRFIFIMESFHISVTRTVGDGVFKGLSIQGSDPLSHLFYADDVVFLGEWSETNLVNLVKILDCFHLAPCLKINLIKSQVLGIGIPRDIVSQGASRIGCDVLRTPFKYFGVTVGFEGGFARNGVDPKYVFYWQRSGRQKDHLDRWDKVLSSKKKGGLGARVTNAIYGSNISSHDDKLSSNWCFIPCEIQVLKVKGFDFFAHCKKKVGNGRGSRFLLDIWLLDKLFYVCFPRIFVLKTVSVAAKWEAPSFEFSFRRHF
nr:RNA-directed DNA polymerase, eukaryota [Tanacetum cinerariifolium]